MAGSNSARSEGQSHSHSVPTISKTIVDDTLALQISDNPAMVLVFVQLNRINYRGWNRTMKITLDAKNKLTFVEGKLAIPEDGSEDYDRWRRCNYMVTSWIVNSISRTSSEVSSMPPVLESSRSN